MKHLFMFIMLLLSPLLMIGQSKDHIKFTAKIANRNSDSLLIKGPQGFTKVLHLDKKGVFAADIDGVKGFYMFSDGTESSTLYLKPKSVVNLVLDAKEFDETIVYKGTGVAESNFLAQKALADEKFLATIFDHAPDQFAKLVEEKKNLDVANLEKGDFDADFKLNMKKSIESFIQYISMSYENEVKAKKLVGTPSPGFDYENYKGGKTKLADLKGKYVYIDLWATWCGPCRAEIPHLQKMEEKYKGKNIEFVSISIDKEKDHDKWRKFVQDKSLGGIQLFADKDWESEFVVNYGVTGIPRFILIDPNGNIVSADASRPSSAEIKTQLDTLLK